MWPSESRKCAEANKFYHRFSFWQINKNVSESLFGPKKQATIPQAHIPYHKRNDVFITIARRDGAQILVAKISMNLVLRSAW